MGVWVSQPISAYVALPPDVLKNWVVPRAIADWFMALSIQVPLILFGLLAFFLMATLIGATEHKRPNPAPRDY